jgi:hypothetical protein
MPQAQNKIAEKLEALWSVRFSSNMGIHGGGVVVIENGKILGGETGYTYIGSMRADRERVIARMKVSKYMAEAAPIFGMDHFEMELTGRPHESQIRFDGFVVGSPQHDISIDLVRRVELP